MAPFPSQFGQLYRSYSHMKTCNILSSLLYHTGIAKVNLLLIILRNDIMANTTGITTESEYIVFESNS